MSAMKTIVLAVMGIVAVCASAQSLPLGRRLRPLPLGRRLRRPRPEMLEPLLPFAEAVEKAKKGDAQGCYALAIHYARGDEIERDAEKARLFLKEAAAADYGNAVLVNTICLERSSVAENEIGRGAFMPDCQYYVSDGNLAHFPHERGKYSLTNSSDVAAIRAGYERAIRLGVPAATNELARFEQRLEAVRADAKRLSDESRQKIDNAAIAKSVLGVPIENMERMEQRCQLESIRQALVKAREAHEREMDVPAQSIAQTELPSAPTNTTISPTPPPSFCGFTFGEVYTNATTVTLAKPFRYCNQATIRTTKNEQRIFQVSIGGTTSESMSDDDAQTEFERMCEVVEKKLGVKMKRQRKYYGYNDKAFSIDAKQCGIKKGIRVFRVEVTRRDILEADKNAAKPGAKPLPPGNGAESL